MAKVFSFFVAGALVTCVFFHETGCRPSAMSSRIQPQVCREEVAVAPKSSGPAIVGVPSLERELQERRQAFNTVVFDPLTTSVATAAAAQGAAPVRAPISLNTGGAGLKSRRQSTTLYPNHSWVEAEGEVAVILSYDPADSRHQKFMVRLDSGKMLLVVHDTAKAPRVENLALGDMIAFCGEYLRGQNGDEIRRTYKDVEGRDDPGWLRHNGKLYQ